MKLQIALLENQLAALTQRVALLESRIAKTHPNKAGERVIASLSSHKGRETALEQVVASITGQVARDTAVIRVILTSYYLASEGPPA